MRLSVSARRSTRVMSLKVDRDTAVRLICSSSPHERLKAARFFAKYAQERDLSLVKAALGKETVSWVRKALVDAVARGEKSQVHAPAKVDSDVSEKITNEIHARAIEEVTATILHEFQPIIGVLKLRAQEEVPDFCASGVKVEIDRMERLLAAIEALKKVSVAARLVDFDLSELLADVVTVETQGAGGVSLNGAAPFLVRGDPDLLRFAVANGLRNAIEANAQSGVAGPHSIVITWGATDIDCWVTIIDSGPGISKNSAAAFKMGTTSKKDHSGMGLPIARQAMLSMEGEIALVPDSNGGARFELRWYRG
jgi:signal transduction histidine kinase